MKAIRGEGAYRDFTPGTVADALLTALDGLLDEESPFETTVDECECGVNGNGFDDKGNPCAHILAMRAMKLAREGK